MKKMRIGAILATTLGLIVLSPAQAEDRGADIFNRLCNRCHGNQGEGMKNLEAPLIAGMPAWYIDGQLRKFRTGVRGTHPKDFPGMRMRPMANTLMEYDVATIAAYVAKMPIQKPAPGLADANLKNGEAGFAVCAGCHGADAKGNQQMNAPTLAGQDGWYLLTQLKNFKAGIRGGNPTLDATGASMRAMAASLDEGAMKDLAAYLQSLKK